MQKHALWLTLPFFLGSCIDFGPTPLILGDIPKTNANNELTLPLNVTKAFTPTGYFYNVWPPADSTFTRVDPEKWNNFLAYQSIFLHPACRDRVPFDTLVKQDTTLARFVSPRAFYKEFACSQFTYAPATDDDLYGGVFWLRNNNFGNHPGVKVDGGGKVVKFWARSLGPRQTIKFGVGVNNTSTLKPWYYFSPYVDTWGKLNPPYTPLWEKKPILNRETGKMVDSLVAQDSVLAGAGHNSPMILTDKWTLYTLNLGILYAFNSRLDTIRISPDSVEIKEVFFDSLPDHRLIGAFFWAMDASFIRDSSHVTDPITLPDGTKRQVKYGSATILIDGIRYE